MIQTPDPWGDIPVPPHGQFSRLRVANDFGLGIFWLRNEFNQPGLLIPVSRTITTNDLALAKLRMRVITVDVREFRDEDLTAIVLTLNETHHKDVFLKLCLDLIEHVLDARHEGKAFQIVCTRLKKWQSLLMGAYNGLLSANEVRGLYAELVFMAELLENDSSREAVVLAGWKGPERYPQDYILGSATVEIKSLSGNDRGKIRISSEDQLDTTLYRVYLRVYFLAESERAGHGESLNELVRRISNQLTTSEHCASFDEKLAAAGYIDIPDYEMPLFRVTACQSYLVADGFPAITRSRLAPGIGNVTYSIELNAIEAFRTDMAEIAGG